MGQRGEKSNRVIQETEQKQPHPGLSAAVMHEKGLFEPGDEE